MNPVRSVSRAVAVALVLCVASVGTLWYASPLGPAHVASGSSARCASGKVLRAGVCASTTQASHIIAIARQQMKLHDLKSVILSVRIGKQNIVTTALGSSMTGVPATTSMHFRNGSVAIAYMATLLLQLVDRKVVHLSDPISKWLPSLPRAKRVTLGMLASMGSSYGDYVPDAGFENAIHADPFRQWTPQERIKIGMKHNIPNAPGTKFSYAHTNYVILGEALQKITGRPVAQLIRQRILNPLGLHNTVSYSTPEIQQPVLHAFSSERGRYEESTFWNPSWAIARGAIMTSDINDVAKSAVAIGTGSLLSRKSHQAQLAHVWLISPPGAPKAYYGLGVFLQGGWVIQNPSYSGYAAIMAYHPSSKIAIAVSSTMGPKSDPSVNYSSGIYKAIAKYLRHPVS